MTIAQNVNQILRELPPHVKLLAAAESRQPQEIREAVSAGIEIIGENYLQEAEKAREAIGANVKWHFIGHLQKNKVKRAVVLFDMIETVDSVDIAREIDRRCVQISKTMPVLIEVNSGREPQKTGVFPENTEELVTAISDLPNIQLKGLMTMGPYLINPEDLRPYFAETKRLFDRLKELKLPGVCMEYLSMGMNDSYKIAVEEGANLVRIGSKIFN